MIQKHAGGYIPEKDLECFKEDGCGCVDIINKTIDTYITEFVKDNKENFSAEVSNDGNGLTIIIEKMPEDDVLDEFLDTCQGYFRMSKNILR